MRMKLSETKAAATTERNDCAHSALPSESLEQVIGLAVAHSMACCVCFVDMFKDSGIVCKILEDYVHYFGDYAVFLQITSELCMSFTLLYADR